MEGQVHLSGNTQYVRTLGMIREGDDQPVKNREMRSLTQKGNQAKFFRRMPGIQRSPDVYNLQHLREYKSCRIWASMHLHAGGKKSTCGSHKSEQPKLNQISP